MSIARSWLWIGLALGACSSRDAGDRTKARDEAKPSPTPGSGSGSGAAPAATPPADDRYDPGALGALTFQHSEGSPEARAHFTRGMLALHSFWYDEAIREFQAAMTADPEMNMAYWGAAMSRCKLLWGEDDLDAARDVMSRMPNPDRLSKREQAWVLAGVELVRGGDVRSSRKRFAEAMAALDAQFSDDESTTFLALALLSTTRPEDPDTTTVRKRAAALAQGVYERNPKHPGAAHYLIHAYDTPELAALALPHAREYAKLAPAAFHARHMPAHIFSRLGMWREAITSCQSAWDASIAAAQRNKLSANHHDFHSLNWLIEMPFELGLRKDADRALTAFAGAVRAGLGHQHRALYATQVASYMMRTGEWSRVDELLAPLEAAAVEEPGAPGASGASTGAAGPAGSAGAAGSGTRASAPSHCAPVPASSPTQLFEQLSVLDARVRAAAARRDLSTTRRLAGELDAVRTKLRPFFLSTQPKEAVAKLDESHARRRRIMLARAAGDDKALLEALRQSVADAEAEVGGESNPSGFQPNEEIADTLLRLGRAKEAAAEYAVALQKHPRRARSILGAARAATKAGDPEAARKAYQQLLELWSAADEGIDGLAEARAAVAAVAPR
jgi:tetratricopeptide (TPR) repeat protein